MSIDYLEEYKRWKNSSKMSEGDLEKLERIKGCDEIIRDCFGENLEFGTAGLRGICGIGTCRMNVHTVRRATQGLSQYLRKKYYNPSVVISYDSRLDSDIFARETAAVLTANGIQAHIFPEMMPVPVLSFAVRKLECTAGVMITASHNPKEYNGYKVYNHTGGQILDQEAESVLEEIETVDLFDDVETMPFEEALTHGCKFVDDEVYEAYLDEIEKVLIPFAGGYKLKIVYSPLNGSGRRPVQDMMRREGFSVFTVPEQEQRDGNFSTCPYPNPEKAEVFELACRYGEELQADILIATDPDCDRVGVMVRQDEKYRLLSGNETGILLLYYICEVTENVFGRWVYTSMVSTPMVDQIAEYYGVKMKRMPVGFKYIGQQIELNSKNFLFGFEESNGYLIGNHCRDKDGVAAAVLICQMAAYFKEKGKNLGEVLNDLYLQFGCISDQTLNLDIGSREEREQMMSLLRQTEKVYAAFPGITAYIDFNESVNQWGFSKMDVLRLDFADESRMIIRPSGTEPKIKIYLSARGRNMENCNVKINDMKTRLLKLMNSK